MKILAQALLNDQAFDLRLELLAGERGLGREITHPRIQKPGLAMAGFVESIQPGRVQVIGKTEMRYLESLEETAQTRSVEGLMACGIACAIISSSLSPLPALLEAAEQAGIPVFRSSHTSGLLINHVHDFLEEHLSSECALHAVLVDVFGVGVLLTGQSGVGKSECALDLVLRGHRMVADDVVIVKRSHNKLVGMGSALTRHHMEVRGLGIISVKDLFGTASVRERKQVELLVEMLDWHPALECDRTGIDEQFEHVMEVAVPKLRLPIRPGRNVAVLVEVAARNHLLKLQGQHSALELKAKIERHLAGLPSPPIAESE